MNRLPSLRRSKPVCIGVLREDVRRACGVRSADGEILSLRSSNVTWTLLGTYLREPLESIDNHYIFNRRSCMGMNARRTRFFWIGKLDCRKFWIWVLLFFHGNKMIEAEAFEAFLDEYMADAMHGRVDKFDVGRRVETSREVPYSCSSH